MEVKNKSLEEVFRYISLKGASRDITSRYTSRITPIFYINIIFFVNKYVIPLFLFVVEFTVIHNLIFKYCEEGDSYTIKFFLFMDTFLSSLFNFAVRKEED